MTMEAHQRAIELQHKIAHVDGILKFLNDILSSNTGSVHASIRNAEVDPVTANKVLLDRAEITVVVKALEIARANLEREFEQL